jgi:hypothetical protein
MPFLAGGCGTPKMAANPLDGWHLLPNHSSYPVKGSIVEDFNRYIQELPPSEKRRVIESNIWFFKNETGQHAVKISIPVNGVWWDHILLYDSFDKRVKAIKCKSGRYRS